MIQIQYSVSRVSVLMNYRWRCFFHLTEKKGIFDIQIEQPLIQVRKREEKRNDVAIEQALSVILKQLEVSGCRERTLYDYSTIVHYFSIDAYTP